MVGLEGFNDDATETKGISLFSIGVLAALPANNTDDEVHGIRSIVAHEYFHNWSGAFSAAHTVCSPAAAVLTYAAVHPHPPACYDFTCWLLNNRTTFSTLPDVVHVANLA
jgi:hypothetical protein